MQVGLRQFVAAGADEKREQMEELGLLVLGIRLFNWAHGKGGANIEDVPAAGAAAAAELRTEIETEVSWWACARGGPGASSLCRTQIAATNELIAHYVDIISALSAGALKPLPAGAGDGWPSELANRRQLATYLASLLDELRVQEAALSEAYAGARAELESLGELVGSRAAVSKEAVYPRFHNIASKWLAAVDAAGA